MTNQHIKQKLDQLERETLELEARVQLIDQRTAPKEYLLNKVTGAWHVIDTMSPELPPPSEWRTACAWPFAGSKYKATVELPTGAGLCSRCRGGC